MAHSGKVSGLLRGIESGLGKVPYTVSTLQSGEIQIVVYPRAGDAQFELFDLRHGLTPSKEKQIRGWFEPFARAESA